MEGTGGVPGASRGGSRSVARRAEGYFNSTAQANHSAGVPSDSNHSAGTEHQNQAQVDESQRGQRSGSQQGCTGRSGKGGGGGKKGEGGRFLAGEDEADKRRGGRSGNLDDEEDCDPDATKWLPLVIGIAVAVLCIMAACVWCCLRSRPKKTQAGPVSNWHSKPYQETCPQGGPVSVTGVVMGQGVLPTKEQAVTGVTKEQAVNGVMMGQSVVPTSKE